MGLDFTIEARILERETNRCISVKEGYLGLTEGYFEICHWFSDGYYLREKLIAIVNKYSNTNYTINDIEIPFPQEALREMYVCILGYACIPEMEPVEMTIDYGQTKLDEYYSFELNNLFRAEQLRTFLYRLDYIRQNNDLEGLEMSGAEEFFQKEIGKEADFEKFQVNPQQYFCEFRIFNSF